jgi:hypothetical protein
LVTVTELDSGLESGEREITPDGWDCATTEVAARTMTKQRASVFILIVWTDFLSLQETLEPAVKP